MKTKLLLIILSLSIIKNSHAMQVPQAELDFFYLLENHYNYEGGIEKKNVVSGLANIEARFNDFALIPSLGRTDLTMSVMGFHGKSPSMFVGDQQWTSNIDTAQNETVKLYELFIEQTFNSNLSFKFGLIDLSKNFITNSGGSNFAHAAAGFPSELASSGPNGAAAYPYPSLGGIVRIQMFESLYLLAAMASEYAGDRKNLRQPQNDGRISGDSHFFITEVGEESKTGKWAIGQWSYCEDADHISKTDNSGDPLRETSAGGYILLEKSWDSFQAFMRYGQTTNQATQPIKASFLVGTSYLAPFKRENDSMGVMMSQVMFSKYYHQKDPQLTSYERTFETYYRYNFMTGLSGSVHLQKVINPSGDKKIKDAGVISTRLLLEF